MVRITKEQRTKMEKKWSKNMGKKDLFRIASMFVMIVLLPLLPALIFVGCEIIAHLTSIKMIQVCKIIIFGTPILLLLAYSFINAGAFQSCAR